MVTCNNPCRKQKRELLSNSLYEELFGQFSSNIGRSAELDHHTFMVVPICKVLCDFSQACLMPHCRSKMRVDGLVWVGNWWSGCRCWTRSKGNEDPSKSGV